MQVLQQNNGIGSRLKGARERVGLSREALAYHSGISWSAIAQVESGRRTNLRPNTLLALAGALGVTIDYLVAGRAHTESMLQHRALLYNSEAEFIASAAPFLSEGIDRSEAVIAVTTAAHIRSLRRQLGARAREVKFAENSAWYRVPVTALDGYRRFLTSALEGDASWIRILGEPNWAGRSEAEIRLLARYESLLNLVFSCAPATVLCPYDARQLGQSVLEHARATHPHALEGQALIPNSRYTDPATFVLRP